MSAAAVISPCSSPSCRCPLIRRWESPSPATCWPAQSSAYICYKNKNLDIKETACDDGRGPPVHPGGELGRQPPLPNATTMGGFSVFMTFLLKHSKILWSGP